MHCPFIAVCHCVVVTTNGPCVVGSNILDILSLCGCPTKLLLQHGSFVHAATVTTNTH